LTIGVSANESEAEKNDANNPAAKPSFSKGAEAIVSLPTTLVDHHLKQSRK
jgi:hypothetical protein